jgi:hypothetical protein
MIKFLEEKRNQLQQDNPNPLAVNAISKTHDFVVEYIEALYSPHFPNNKIPLIK